MQARRWVPTLPSEILLSSLASILPAPLHPSWTRRQHGSRLPSGMLYFSSSSLPKREAREDLVKFAYSQARRAPYPAVSLPEVDLALARGSGAVGGSSLLGKAVGRALAWPQENCLLHRGYLFCVAILHVPAE